MPARWLHSCATTKGRSNGRSEVEIIVSRKYGSVMPSVAVRRKYQSSIVDLGRPGVIVPRPPTARSARASASASDGSIAPGRRPAGGMRGRRAARSAARPPSARALARPRGSPPDRRTPISPRAGCAGSSGPRRAERSGKDRPPRRPSGRKCGPPARSSLPRVPRGPPGNVTNGERDPAANYENDRAHRTEQRARGWTVRSRPRCNAAYAHVE